MKRFNLFTLILLSALSLTIAACDKGDYGKTASPATTGTGSITILSPKNGAVLDSGSGDKLTYNVHLSPNGNHLHVYIDDQPPIIDRNVSDCPCSLELPTLSAGPHVVAVKEATVHHVLTGLESTIQVTVK